MQQNPQMKALEETELQRLRALLLGADAELLLELRSWVNDPETLQENLSAAVTEAIKLRNERDGSINQAFVPVIERTLTESVARNPEKIADALYPVIGRAIRLSIAETLNQALDDLNDALRNTLSWRNVKWRMDAWRTGKSYAEVAMLSNLDFQVEQVFLIHRESSLLLEHAVVDSTEVMDADLVSGMLGAIREFVSDSFDVSDRDGLNTLRLGELTLCIESGPEAVLAAVVRGGVREELRSALKEAIETIHIEQRSQFANFQGNTDAFSVCKPVLEACLLSKSGKRLTNSRRVS